ncbi:Phosphatidylinositol-4-phosphate 5-kinase [Pestalotiopsis sp. 9143b]|nr:Phosphatidylinositol-4-phosphate 5-kinase [Pestalotiopsis sp. 9143b]
MAPCLPVEPPSRDYQDEDETQDSRLKTAWDGVMGGLKTKHNAHEKVSALLLSWHPDVDDLKTDQEVRDLEEVFKSTFKYETTRATLTNGAKKSAQIQVHRHLSQFVYDNDDGNTLLIIYYAGHGRPGKDPGGLHLTGSTSLPSSGSSKPHEVVWNSAEVMIKDTKADVLVIFDCCYAGELERSVRGPLPRRAFEFLAATSANSTTPKPGRRSFTSALIHSLKGLVQQGSFSTQELVRRIKSAPDFPEEQWPRLHERQASERKIMLSALTQESVKEAREAYQSIHQEEHIGNTRQDLLVRLIFDKAITEPMVEEVAKQMKHLIDESEIKAKTVSWEGLIMPSNLSYKDFVAVQRYARAWQGARNRSPVMPQTPKTPVKDAIQGPSPWPSSTNGSCENTPDLSYSPAESESSEGLGISGQKASSVTLEVDYHARSTTTPIIAQPRAHKRVLENDEDTRGYNTSGKRTRFDDEQHGVSGGIYVGQRVVETLSSIHTHH